MKKYIVFFIIIFGAGVVFYKNYVLKHTFKTTSAKKSDMIIKINGTGKVGAKNIYKVSSMYGGEILKFHINESDFIKKGEIIAKIDFIDLKDKIDEQKTIIKKLTYDIKALQSDRKGAFVKYDYQKELYLKNEKLFLNKSISALEFKKYKSDYKVAKYLVDTLDIKIDSLKTQILQINIGIKGLEKKLSKYTITAPIDGYVVKKYISNHQIINPSQPIIDIVNPKDVWIETFIDTKLASYVKIKNSATIKLRSQDKSYKAKVLNIKPIGNNITYEREVDIGFDHLPIPFYLEEQANVDIVVNKLQNVTQIPIKTLINYQNQDGIWILKNNKAKFKPVKILNIADNFAAVEEVDMNAKIIIPDNSKKTLADDMKVWHD